MRISKKVQAVGRGAEESGGGSGISLINLIATSVVVLVAMMVGSVTPAMAAESRDEAAVEATLVLLAPLSGERSAVGRQLLETAKMSGEGLGLRVEAMDGGGSVEEMLVALDSLRGREDVAAVVAVVSRRRAGPAAQRAQEIGVPMVVYSATKDVERVGDVVFRGRPNLAEQGERVAGYLVEEMGIEDVAVMAPRSSYGDEALVALVEALSRSGAVVSSFSQYEQDATNFQPALEVLVGRRIFLGPGRSLSGGRVDRFGTLGTGASGSGSFEALIIADSDEVVARLLPFLPRVGLQTGAGGAGRGVQLVGLSAWRGDGLVRAGEHASGAIFFDTFGGMSSGGQVQQFEEGFHRRFGREATTAEAEVYDLVAMIGSGIRARQEGESWADAALARLREPTAYPGVAGSWSFDEDGAPLRYLRPFRVVDEGRWVPLGGGAR